MKVAHRAVTLIGIVALSSSLVACGGDEKTPTETIKEYTSALNEGDFDTALGLVAEPGDVTAEKMVKLDGIDIPEPKAVDTEYGEDEESLSLQYDVGGDEVSVGFIQGDDGWKVREPVFLTDTHTALAPDEETTVGLVDSGSTITTADGVDILDKRYAVVTGEPEEIPLTVSFPGNRYVEGQELKANGRFHEESSADGRSTPWFRVASDFGSDDVDWVITDSFYEEMKTYAMNQPPSEYSHSTRSTVAFATKDQCDLSWPVVDAGETFSFHCEGGTWRRTYTETYDSADGPRKKGETKDEVAHFNFKVENGEIVDS